MNANTRNKTILIIDEDADYRELMTLFLQLEGIDTISAANGVDAMGIIGSPPPDLIITEWNLPMMDGLRLLQWLREESGHKIPVLVLTASDTTDIEQRAWKAGAAGVILKPVRPETLLSKIKKLILREE